MERQQRSAGVEEGAYSTEAVAALRTLPACDGEPILLAAYPSFVTNPYQALLYGACRDHGIAPVRVRRDEQLDEVVAVQRAGVPTVLHLHWLHLVLRDAETEAEADRLLGRFLRRLDAFRAAGGILAWTVHNILPHETRFEAQEARLSAEVAARSDIVHAMAPRTAELVAPYYPLPTDRLLYVPHMSYLGAYEDYVSRSDARQELGLLPDDFVYLVLGAIRPYKGLTELLDAWQALPVDGVARRLVIAGAPSDERGVAELIERAAIEPTILLDARKIPAPEMQVFLRAADVAVLPYRRSLNSGALLLALTFGLPAIVPSGSGLADMVDERFARTFDSSVDGGLVAALLGAADLATPIARAAAEAAAAAVSPAEVSRQFAIGLREMLERRAAGRTEGPVAQPA